MQTTLEPKLKVMPSLFPQMQSAILIFSDEHEPVAYFHYCQQINKDSSLFWSNISKMTHKALSKRGYMFVTLVTQMTAYHLVPETTDQFCCTFDGINLYWEPLPIDNLD